jgi:ribonuclease HII
MVSVEKRRTISISQFESELLAKGEFPFAGVDEAGRGPLAGPVIAAAVIWNYDIPADSIKDSKLLSGNVRRELFDYIITNAHSVAIGWATPAEIDKINILRATLLAMSRAVFGLGVKPNRIIIDGNQGIPNLKIPQNSIVDGDALILAVSAASIVAKVARDKIMEHFDALFPGYGFFCHRGYGTAEHKEALSRLGPCPIHRKTFAGVVPNPALF